jgi:hypothetical protein
MKQSDLARLNALIDRLDGLLVDARQLVVSHKEATLSPADALALGREPASVLGEPESMDVVSITTVHTPAMLPPGRVDPRVEVMGPPALPSGIIDVEVVPEKVIPHGMTSAPRPDLGFGDPPCPYCLGTGWVGTGSDEAPRRQCFACSSPTLPAPEPEGAFARAAARQPRTMNRR